MESTTTPAPESPAPAEAPATPASKRGAGGPSLALLLVLAAGFLPLLVAFFGGLWARPAYRFFPIGLVAAGAVCWLGARRTPTVRLPGPAWLTAVLLGLALGGLALATVLWSPWVGAAAAVVAVLGVANWVGGPALLRAWLPGWLILLTVLPLPLGLDERVFVKMRTVLVALSRPLLGYYQVVHVVRADGIEVPGKVVPLESACLGLYLIPAAMALALVLTALFRRGGLHGLVVALTMPAWVFLGTVVWLVAGLKLAAGGGLAVFSGLGAAAAIFLFLIALGGLALSMDQFVRFWTAPSRSTAGRGPAEQSGPRRRRAVATSRLGWGAAAMFALLGLAQTGLAMRGYLNAPSATVVVAPLPMRTMVSLPPEISGWRQFTNRFSALDDLVIPSADAQAWHYARGELAASITLEQSLIGYRSILDNYLAARWRVLRVTGVGGEGPGSAPFVTAELQKDIFQNGRVWFAVGDSSGKWLSPPRPQGRTEWLGASAPPPWQGTFRIQLFVGSLDVMTQAEVESAENLFQTVRQQLAAQLTGQPLIQNAPAKPE